VNVIDDIYQRISALEEAVRARGEFISVAAHELRNPLTPIVLMVDMLRTQAQGLPGADGLMAGFDRLDRAIAAYLRRTTALLNASRLSSGNFRAELSAVDLSALIREVADHLAVSAARAGSPLILSIADGIGGNLDQLGVEEIADNLLTNALKYGAGKPVEVSLAREGDYACLRVRDHGIGISAENQARIFARFERAVTRSEHGGFGIGLWMVGRLVEAMDGTISVESRSGEGASFTVKLPLTG
jgi:two-component system OmpR family sensor kinase